MFSSQGSGRLPWMETSRPGSVRQSVSVGYSQLLNVSFFCGLVSSASIRN